MNTNKYEFDSTDEVLKLPDFHFDQNVPVQGPEAQALEAQGPENQAPALQLAAHGSVMPSTAQLQEGKSSADINFDQNMLPHINFDQNHPDQVPSVGTYSEDLAQYYVSQINVPEEMSVFSDFDFDQNYPALALEAEVQSSDGARHRYNLTELDGASVNDKSDPRLSSGVGPSNTLMSMPGESRHSYSLPLDTRSGDGPVVTDAPYNPTELEMFLLSDFDSDQNDPAQALEAEVPSSAGARHRYNLTELDGAPVNDKSDPRLNSRVGPSNTLMSMPGESRHSYSLPLDTRSGDGPVVTDAPYNLTELEMFLLSDFDSDQNDPAQALEAEVPSSAGAHRYNLTELDGAPVNDKSDPRLSSGAGPSNTRMSMPGESRHSYSLPLDTRSGDGPAVTEGSDDSSLAFAQLLKVGMSPADAEKAMMDKTLNKIALSDPKIVKRKWGNRQSAARSTKRKAEDQAKLETQFKTLQTQRDALANRQALGKKNVDALTHENTQLKSNVEVIQQQNRILDSWTYNLRMAVNHLRIKAGLVDPNSGPPGMMMPSGVHHNNFSLNRGPPRMMMPSGIPRNNVALNRGPPGMMMPFRVPHNNLSLNPHQQAAQAHARMQQQQQPRLVLPRRTPMLLQGADASGSAAGREDDVPGQGP